MNYSSLRPPSSLDAPATPTTDDPRLKQIAKDVNDLRRKVAQKYNVPNMHKLVWCEDLAKNTFSWYSTGNNLGYFAATVSFDIRESLEKEMDKYVKMDTEAQKEYMEAEDDALINLLIPLQRFIGCHVNTSDDSMECLTGPNVFIRIMFDVSSNSSEVLGSKCKAKSRNDDGLCVAKEEPESYFHGDPPEFVNGVNLVRTKYAEEYNVGDMHPAVCNEKLVAPAIDFTWGIFQTQPGATSQSCILTLLNY